MYRVASFLLCFFYFIPQGQAAPKMELRPFWNISNEQSTQVLDHSAWQQLLDRYLDARHLSGINRFDYAAVTSVDHRLLERYLQQLQKLDPRELSRAEQKAYWINLYNALTVAVVLKHYPVTSIKKTGEGFFSFGPWDDTLAKMQGRTLSLNQIEHGILRPIWRDTRIHYVVNCASLSCPNLQLKVFTGANTELLLERSAASYVNHSRAVEFDGEQLRLSSIYEWYSEDFGADEKALLAHLLEYAEGDLAKKLARYLEGFRLGSRSSGDIVYHYDWILNAP